MFHIFFVKIHFPNICFCDITNPLTSSLTFRKSHHVSDKDRACILKKMVKEMNANYLKSGSRGEGQGDGRDEYFVKQKGSLSILGHLMFNRNKAIN